MRILFVHTNFPAQFKHMAAALAKQPGSAVAAIGSASARALPGVHLQRYHLEPFDLSRTHPFARRFVNSGRLSQPCSLAGLSLHWVGRLPIHDATNNFKLYRRSFLNSVTIESKGGFELAIELSVKADLAGRKLAELPTTWRDRTAGQSRFKLRAWLPLYLRWYLYLFRGRLRRPARAGRGSSRRPPPCSAP